MSIKLRKKKKERKYSLYFITIGSVIIVMLIFALSAMSIGYYAFTRSFEKEYSDSVSRVAELSSYIIGETNVDDYLEYEQEELDDLYDNYETYYEYQAYCAKHNQKVDNQKYLTSDHYGSVKKNLTSVCDTMGMSVIYVIKPSDDYKQYTCIFNCVSKDSKYDPWPLGKVVDAPSEYHDVYKRIMEEGSKSETVARFDNLGEGKPHITALVPVKNFEGEVVAILCVQRFADQLTGTRRNFVQGVGAISLILIIMIIWLESRLLRNSVIKPINRISDEADRFAKYGTKEDDAFGNQVYRVKEVDNLAHSLEKMEDDTINNIENIKAMVVEQERIGADLSLASKIQMGMLPLKNQLLTDMDEFDIHAIMTPAKEVGGDFYDFYMIDDTHLAIEIADVSDKGVGAAFFMAISKTLIKSRAGMGGSATDIIAYVDKMISEKNAAGMFVTVWFAIIDLETGHVDVCNAGHDYPALMLKGEDFVVEKTPHGPPVGFIPGATFVGTSFDMEPGDRIFLYTDGLNEAKRSDGERFGMERMLTVLNNHKGDSNERMIASMADAVRYFVGGEPQFDDMTMLGFTLNKTGNKKNSLADETE